MSGAGSRAAGAALIGCAFPPQGRAGGGGAAMAVNGSGAARAGAAPARQRLRVTV